MNGALLVDKPEGISSFDVVFRLQKAYGNAKGLTRKDWPKMGHGGTLDPFATGLLVICVGSGVKLSRYFLDSKKAYTGEIAFGQTTESGDLTNPVTATTAALPKSKEELQRLADEMCKGSYFQVPPMYSAKKHAGKPLYELARAGKEVEREPKECFLSDFVVTTFEPTRASIQVSCTSGTYIRVLAQDLAVKAGSLGHLRSLRRTQSGAFHVSSARTLSDLCLEENVLNWESLSNWVPFNAMLSKFPKIELTREEALGITQGQRRIIDLLTSRFVCETPAAKTLALYYKSNLVATFSADAENKWSLDRVFRSPEQL